MGRQAEGESEMGRIEDEIHARDSVSREWEWGKRNVDY